MPLPVGQQIAAFVQYTKRKPEWIIASVLKYNEDNQTYDVQDKFPENRKKIYYDNIPERNVEPFPCPEGTAFPKGAKVLALWMIDEKADEWTTVFYKARVVEPTVKTHSKSQTVTIIFPNDRETYMVDISKVVPRTVRPKVVEPEPETKPSPVPIKRSSSAVDSTPKRAKQDKDSESNSEHVPIVIKKENEPYTKPPPTPIDALFRTNFAFSQSILSTKGKIFRNYSRIAACRTKSVKS